MREGDLTRPDGRTVHWYDGGPEDASLVLFWHHGTPNIGQPPGPLMEPATQRGMRWVALDRPGYGDSTRREGRCVGDVAADVAAVADHLGIERWVTIGHSGGGPHALATAALMPARVLAAVSIAGLAPRDADGLDWFGGMHPQGRAELEAAGLGPAALEAQLAGAEWDDEAFTSADHGALAGEWSWFGPIVEAATEHGPAGMVDDDIAFVTPWGFAPERAGSAAPVLLVHGGQDRIVPPAHSDWLGSAIPGADLRVFPDAGHISVLLEASIVLDWIADKAGEAAADGA